jgi:hypothetical protein
LPLLHEGQQGDVQFAEGRFAMPNGHGVLFTNGTGTGKTYTGLGVIKRFARQGKDNILIVAPNDKIIEDWIARGADIAQPITKLTDTKDHGNHGVVVTTYANLAQNNALVKRNWDLIVTDEAHYLSANAEGDVTGAGHAVRALTLHPSGAHTRAEMLEPELVESIRVNQKALREANRAYDLTEAHKINAELDRLLDRWRVHVEKVRDDVEARQQSRPKALFLSATPFAYVKSIEWAQGYLFDWNEGADLSRQGGYNEPNPRQQFFIRHFGFRMRYGKLTEPEAGVESAVMEVAFNGWLQKQGALSGRMLDVTQDYERKFALTDDALGRTIDAGLEALRSEDHGRYAPLYEMLKRNWSYHDRMFLLEAIKAKKAVELTRAHLALGRKVVVFHDFNKGGGFHPFQFAKGHGPNTYVQAGHGQHTQQVLLDDLIAEFEAKHPELVNAPFIDIPSPLAAFAKAFGDKALFFNGTVNKAERLRNVAKFNADDSGDNLIVVQSDAGKEGISLHDVTGKHQRALVNLGMPIKPTQAIQIEGRTYRVGQASDAIFLYLNTGTNFERATFAHKIAERSSTAENLAIGEQARALKQSFIDAFTDSIEDYRPSRDEGTGGKAKDRAAQSALSPFDRAKSYYWANQKKTSRNKAREGRDYFATPEPLGFKMVEWADIRANDRVLEPSAGHGAIARFIPETANTTMIEPSMELGTRAALANSGKLISDSFENHHAVNKYEAIVMNPPFGHAGATAWDHVAKAFDHLADRGRVLAIVPNGSNSEKRYEKFLTETPGVQVVATIKLPTSTFERAGTGVSTTLYVFDRYLDPKQAPSAMQKDRDLSDVKDIKELFDRLQDMELRPRDVKQLDVQPAQTAQGAPAATQGASTQPAAQSAPAGLLEAAETKHSRTGEPLYVVRLTKRVDADQYQALARAAKVHGGWYSSFRGSGAIPGFQFKDQAKRDRFLADNQAAFSRSPDGGPIDAAVHFMKALADHDEAFQLPRTDGRRVEDIAKAMAPDMDVKHVNNPFRPSGEKSSWMMAKPDGTFGTLYEGTDGTAWVDLSMLSPGEGGNAMYQIAASYAHNNGLTFVGDEGGFSPNAQYRRTEQMLSSALRYGTTRHLRPHPYQTKDSWTQRRGTRRIDWIDGDDAHNFRELLLTSLYNTRRLLPGMAQLEYDFAHGRFRDRQSGQFLNAADMGRIAGYATGGTARIGRATLARAVLIQSLVRRAGSQGRDAVLAASNALAGQLLPSDLQDTLYSRGNGRGLRAAVVRNLAQGLTRTWANAPGVYVVEKPSDLPFAAPPDARGAFHAGRVYLVAGNLSDARDVQFALFHETLGHYGLRGTFGALLDDTLQQLHDRNANVRAAAAAWKRDNKPAGPLTGHAYEMRAIEEALSDVAGSGKKLTGLRRLALAIQRALRAIGLDHVADWLEKQGNAQVLDVLAKARTFVERGPVPQWDGTAAALSQPAPIFRSALTEGIAAKAPFAKSGEIDAQQLAKWLDARTKDGLFKADELEWSGLKDWLALQSGKVSREQVDAYLRSNGVRVGETVLGEEPTAEEQATYDAARAEYVSERVARMRADYQREQDDQLEHLLEQNADQLDPYYVEESEDDDGNTVWVLRTAFSEDEEFDTEEEAQELADKYNEQAAVDFTTEMRNAQTAFDEDQAAEDAGSSFDYNHPVSSDAKDTKFPKYALPGGQHYRELLLTLPVQAPTRCRVQGVPGR